MLCTLVPLQCSACKQLDSLTKVSTRLVMLLSQCFIVSSPGFPSVDVTSNLHMESLETGLVLYATK